VLRRACSSGEVGDPAWSGHGVTAALYRGIPRRTGGNGRRIGRFLGSAAPARCRDGRSGKPPFARPRAVAGPGRY